MNNQSCLSRYLGPWQIRPEVLETGLAMYRQGALQQVPDSGGFPNVESPRQDGGVGIIPIIGEITKFDSKFGGTSSVRARKLLRVMADDSSISRIVLHIDSPGGMVAGTDVLAGEIAEVDRSVKPVIAQIEDEGASAAYRLALSARAIYATRTSLIGSIGTMVVLYDTSAQAESEGIRAVVITTGPFKGLGVAGTEITEDMKEYVQEITDGMNAFFLDSVRKNRRMTQKQLERVSDGRVWIAAEAQQMKLIDGIQTLEETIAQQKKEIRSQQRRRRQSQKLSLASRA